MAFKLFDYQSSGKGVSKNAPQKKPFFRFFEIFARKFWKLFELNLIFILFCIPIVTFGPAVAALTHVMRKFILEQPCFVFEEFFTAFKKNFKQSVGVGIIDLICIASLVLALYNFLFLDNLPDGYLVYMCLFIGLGTVFYMMHFYIYLEIVALKLGLKAIFKNALLLVFLGVKRNFLALLINLVLITIMVFFFPFSMLALPFVPLAWMSFTTVFICYPVIQKFIVNPYYEEKGEKNPELPDDTDSAESLFVDMGGKEQEIKSVTKTHGKVIK